MRYLWTARSIPLLIVMLLLGLWGLKHVGRAADAPPGSVAPSKTTPTTRSSDKLDDMVDVDITALWDKANQVGVARKDAMVAVASLAEKAQNDPDTVLRQALLYAGTHRLEVPLDAGAILGLSKPDILRVAIPLMGNANARVQNEIRVMLGSIERSKGLPDYSYYESYLGIHIKDPPKALVRHMLKRSPSDALVSFAIVYTRDQKDWRKDVKFFRVAAHRVDEYLFAKGWDEENLKEAQRRAVAAVADLLKREEWWARAYVAVIVTKYQIVPALLDNSTVEKLRVDPNEIVRSVMNEG